MQVAGISRSWSGISRSDDFDRTFGLLLSHATSVSAVLFLGLYAYTALSRVTFSFDLEWIEGAVVDHVLRLLQGQQLYGPPSLAFVPLVYPPGYYYLAAAAATILGASVVTLRIVSILCSLGVFGMLVAFGRRERGSFTDGIQLAGLFAATYVIGGAWLDLARVDALFLLLTLAAVYLLRFGETGAAMAAAGALLAGGLLTKQVMLTIAPPLLLYSVVRLGRRGLIAVAAFLLTTIVAVAGLEWLNQVWFLHYTFYALTATQAVWNDRLIDFWTEDLLKCAPIATILAFGWCLTAWRISTFEDWSFYLLAAVALVGSTWQVRLHPGAWLNTLLPAYVFVAMAGTRAARALNHRVPGVGSALVMAQLALLVYNPQHYVPSRADRAGVERLLGELRSVPGDVLMLSHGYFPRLAGKRTYAHEMAVRDVLTTGDEWAHRLRSEIRHAVEAEQFDLIVQDTPNWFPVPIERYYRRTARLFASPYTLLPPAGAPGRPEFVYEPRERRVERLVPRPGVGN